MQHVCYQGGRDVLLTDLCFDYLLVVSELSWPLYDNLTVGCEIAVQWPGGIFFNFTATL